MSKNLKTILELRDKSFKLMDYLRFDSHYGPFDEMKAIHEGLSNMLWESLGEYQTITATEDCIIKPGETKVIKTDLDKIPVSSIEDNRRLEFTNEGVISTYGFLSFDFVRDYENGNKIFVTNHVPKEVAEKHDLCGFHYCTPETTRHFGPGIYRIEAETIIGIAGINHSLDFSPQKIKEKI